MKAKLKRLVKFLISVFMYYSGMLHLFSALKKREPFDRKVNILMYHRVLSDEDKSKVELQPGMCVLQSTFEQQIRFLSKKYHLVSLKQLEKMLSNKKTPLHRSVIITFDDGWRDNYDYGFPVLKKYKTPAAIFLATDFIGTKKLPLIVEVNLLLSAKDIWPVKAIEILKETAQEKSIADNPLIQSNAFEFVKYVMGMEPELQNKILDKMRDAAGLSDPSSRKRWMLNWEEIRQMDDSNITFGSHGKSHRLFTDLAADELNKELSQSKSIIENKLDTEVFSIAYPNGNYDDTVKQAAIDCGYKIGMAVNSHGRDDQYPDSLSLGRISINEGGALGPRGRFSKAVFACLLEELF